MLNNIQKKLSTGTFSHFFHFFAVFTGIFVIMTIIILQIMRYGLYSSVDTTLQNAANNASDYVTRTMERSDSIQSDNTINESGKNKSSSNDGLSNVSVLLYDCNGKIVNALDAFIQFGSLTTSVNDDKIGEISEEKMTTIFGQTEKYHVLTVRVYSSDYPTIQYATFLISVRQLDEANERYVTITITVMVIFWIISILASVYLANWTRKPILESYEKQKRFVENASHELRTPLAVLQNRLESLFRRPDATILDNSESIAASLDEVRNMRILTTNLLNLARRDDGLKVELEEIHPSTFNEIFENYQMIAHENNKKFTAHNLANRPIKSDKTLLKQLMTILFDNAIKYTGDDGVIEFTIKTTERQTILTIADNGPGVSDADKQKIFDRFYRVDKARTRQQGGFGLGLSLAKQIVDALKGDIQVKDNKPKGTIFEVRFNRHNFGK
ncbi:MULTISPECIES: cell wall metabolism sensor histidine kinase WalK [Streptococcus]|jgi:two-component system sensor histidine kinase CiaH|uniref:histidine kinase n=1 Tax=Streptococcus equinus TaxID=1335 RepID=A0A239R9B2_STREI|nr:MULTISPECIES: HAMP domain-containing sensor histidine kinase [Streptococcus]KEY48103.1 histidine kinase [Streptococcus equinus]KFN85476.1 TCS sensor kinase ciaH [Streptococcus equinus ATCC 33317]MDO4885696.1 HAMP domain-containing sensor histidine kinase [Streptococcus sp.]QMS95559.1 HAMP domain-containing histidine kinase [Streptococcus equinus]SDQ15634.1 two-component system, OmpR family, sensor histidine kinase CiaH [Streptococcus equinus]